MGFRKASGTKPSQLTNPVPGEDVEEQMSSEPVKSVDLNAPKPELQVQVSDLPSVDEAAVESVEPVKNIGIDNLPSVDDLGVEPAVDIRNFEIDIVGKKGRVREGAFEFYDEDKKEWRKPSKTEKFIAGMTLDSIANAPAIGGQFGGAAIGSVRGPGTAAAGGVLAGTAASTLNEEFLSKLRQNPESAKYIAALEALSGESADPMGPAETAALSILGEGVGAVLGRAFKRGAKMLKGADEQVEAAFKESLPAVKETAEAAEKLGIDVKAADVASQLPGGGEIAEAELMASQGLLGKEAKVAYERQIKQQQDALKAVIQDAKRMVGVEDAATDLAKVERRGFDKLNIVDRYMDRWKKTLGSLRQGVSETARQQKYDATQLMEGVKSKLRSFPDHERFLSKEGNLNVEALKQYSKNYLGSEQEAKIFVDQVALLNNMVSRQSALARSQGTRRASVVADRTAIPDGSYENFTREFDIVSAPYSREMAPGMAANTIENLGPNYSGGAEAGLTFDQVSTLVDRFQEVAQKTGDSRLKELSGMAASYENDIMEKAYKASGNDSMATTVKAAKETFSKEIDELEGLSKRIKAGIEKGTLGDAIFKMPAEDLKLFKSFLSKEELAEARMKAFNSAVLNESILNPSKTINASYLEKKFLKDEKTKESMIELFGKDGYDNIKAAVNIAKVLENKDLNPKAFVRVTNDLSGQLMKMEKKLGMVQYGKAIIGFLSGSNEKAAKMLSENIANYEAIMKPKPSSRMIGALEAGAEASSLLQGNQVGKALLFENLMAGQPEQ